MAAEAEKSAWRKKELDDVAILNEMVTGARGKRHNAKKEGNHKKENPQAACLSFEHFAN